MYQLTKFFDAVFRIAWKLALTVLLLLGIYVAYSIISENNQPPKDMKIKISEKFEEEGGFTFLNKDIKNGNKEKKVRVEFLNANSIETNIFVVSEHDFNKLENDKVYTAVFLGGKLKYIKYDQQEEAAPDENKK